jgi:predicted nuclease with TOPRIM domain
VSLQNVIVVRAADKRLTERNSELEGQCRAITTSYSVLQSDVREVKAKNKDLEKRMQELEAELEVERRSRLEWARHELVLRAENDGLKALLLSAGAEMGHGGREIGMTNETST